MSIGAEAEPIKWETFLDPYDNTPAGRMRVHPRDPWYNEINAAAKAGGRTWQETINAYNRRQKEQAAAARTWSNKQLPRPADMDAWRDRQLQHWRDSQLNRQVVVPDSTRQAVDAWRDRQPSGPRTRFQQWDIDDARKRAQRMKQQRRNRGYGSGRVQDEGDDPGYVVPGDGSSE